MKEIARDEAVNRLAVEIHRLLHRADADSDTSAVVAATEAYTEGRYTDAVQQLAHIAALHTVPDTEQARRAADVLGAMARQYRRTAPAQVAYPEEALLALLLTRTALAKEK